MTTWHVYRDNPYSDKQDFLIGTVSRSTDSNTWVDGFSLEYTYIPKSSFQDHEWELKPVTDHRVKGNTLYSAATKSHPTYSSKEEAFKAVIAYFKEKEQEAIKMRQEVSKTLLGSILDNLTKD